MPFGASRIPRPTQSMAHFESQPAPVPSATMYPFQLTEARPEWSSAIECASGSVAHVHSVAGDPLGCGILIGIDRLLVPAHLVEGGCTLHFKVVFPMTDGYTCFDQEFNVRQFLEVNGDLDYAIVLLDKAQTGPCHGRYPGNVCPIAKLRCKHHSGQYLLVHSDAGGSTVASIGDPCVGVSSDTRYCAYSETGPGSSGGGYFDKNGALFAMHSARVAPHCGVTGLERTAVFIQDILRISRFAGLPPCTSICPRKEVVSCISKVTAYNPCLIPEKGRPAVSGTLTSGAYTCKYWEQHPRNNRGPGPRGVRITINETKIVQDKKKRKKTVQVGVTDEQYRISPNPHDVRGYNSDQQTLYETAAKIRFEKFLRKEKVGDQIGFSAYGQPFSATLL